MNGERLRPQPRPEPEHDPEIEKILENDVISTWENIPEEAAFAYRQMVAEGGTDPEIVRTEKAMVDEFRHLASSLNARESFLMRMRAPGVLSDDPMTVEDVKRLFTGDKYKRSLIGILAKLPEEDIKELPGSDLFAHAVLTALGKLPRAEQVYTWNELAEILGMNRETLRQGYQKEMKQLGQLMKPLKKFLREE